MQLSALSQIQRARTYWVRLTRNLNEVVCLCFSLKLVYCSVLALKPKEKKVTKPVSTNVTKPKQARPPKVHALPRVTWIPLETDLHVPLVEDRIFIREFVLRFGDVLTPPIAKARIEEFEEVDGGSYTHYTDDPEFVPWVGADAVKALVLGTLGVIAGEENSDLSQVHGLPTSSFWH